jgi:hypothetical protein
MLDALVAIEDRHEGMATRTAAGSAEFRLVRSSTGGVEDATGAVDSDLKRKVSRMLALDELGYQKSQSDDPMFHRGRMNCHYVLQLRCYQNCDLNEVGCVDAYEC